MSFLDGRLERLQPIFANDALGIVGGGDVGTGFGLAVHGEVFRRAMTCALSIAGAVRPESL